VEFTQLTLQELLDLQKDLQSQFDVIKQANLKLDLTRGKPSAEQLSLSNSLDSILDAYFVLQDGTDVRNYGGILGIMEARILGSKMLGTRPDEVLAGGNSSLALMYQLINFAHLHGLQGPGTSWQAEAQQQQGQVKFLCPVPGYDRHFTICEFFGIEMINIAFNDDGPDMDKIEALVATDPLIKGIWCVPKYSNPTGHTYSDDTVRRMAALGNSAGANFRVMWDNAYVVHHLTDNPPRLLNIMEECRSKGTEDNLIITGSTSKITFAGGGISFLCSSRANIDALETHLTASVIGQDKVNQLRHVLFLKDQQHLLDHMQKHKQILRPKFDHVVKVLDAELAGKGMGSWTDPKGGYFISFDSLPGLAKKIIALAAELGVKLTPAGATFPYRQDVEDTNIRLAPTFPPIDDLDQAMKVFVVSVQLASVQQRIQQL
jgi:aspartate/methionine/tyrosine aminotransferase|tara:strand:+ start:1415 stop:2710 length:1296 start_codon:yes stop_codon:yes gene_type:complete